MDSPDSEMLKTLERSLGGPDGPRLAEWVREKTSALAALERDFKKQKIDFSTILEIAGQINSKGLNLSRIEAYTMTLMRGQFGVRDVWIIRQDSFDSETITVTAPQSAEGNFTTTSSGNFAKFIARSGKPMLRSEFEEGAGIPEFKRLKGMGVEMLIPLIHSGQQPDAEFKGILCLGPKMGNRSFSDEDKSLASILGNLVAVSLDNARLYHRSIVDALTRVYSRGHFDAHLLQEISRAQRHIQKEDGGGKIDESAHRCVSLVMADIDKFKEFNDSFGHQVGDAVLREVARVFHDSVRVMDVVARYGGEEFALVFPETLKEDAVRIAERLRKSVERISVDADGAGKLKVTVSLGVATFPEDAKNLRELIASADKAMYKAKSAGRNRVEVS